MRHPHIVTRLGATQVACLQQMYRETRCPRIRIRVQMILLSHQGRPPAEIAQITQQSDDTVRRWLRRFEAEGCKGLIERPRSGRPAQVTQAVEHFLWGCLQQSPRAFGIERPTWTTAHLAYVLKRKLHVPVTDECIRQHLGKLGFVCRRPTWTVKPLAHQQPGYAQKKGRFPACYGIPPGEQTSTCRMRLR